MLFQKDLRRGRNRMWLKQIEAEKTMGNKKDIFLCIVSLLCLLLGGPATSRADKPLIVAVAANFAPALEEIGRKFSLKTSIPVKITVSSSGRLYAQIKNSAPYDLFFSADQERPERLFTEGLCEQPIVYAFGSVVLWNRDPGQCSLSKNWQNAIRQTNNKNIGMANPELAPYGAATKEALKQEKLWNRLQDRLVFGTNVAQAFQYAATGATTVSFIALSLTHTRPGMKGCFLPIPEARPVAQAVCLVHNSTNKNAAERFLTFMRSAEAGTILLQYGYKIKLANTKPE